MSCANKHVATGNNNASTNSNGDTFEVPEQSLYVQKNKSTGNLLSKTQETAERGRVRYSIDAGTTQELKIAKWVPGHTSP